MKDNNKDNRMKITKKILIKILAIIIIFLLCVVSFKFFQRKNRVDNLSESCSKLWDKSSVALGSTSVLNDGELNFISNNYNNIKKINLYGKGNRIDPDQKQVETKDYYIIRENNGNNINMENFLFDGTSNNLLIIDKKTFKIKKSRLKDSSSSYLCGNLSNNTFYKVTPILSNDNKRSLEISKYKINNLKPILESTNRYNLSYFGGNLIDIYGNNLYIILPKNNNNEDYTTYNLVKLNNKSIYELTLNDCKVMDMNFDKDKLFLVINKKAKDRKIEESYLLIYSMKDKRLLLEKKLPLILNNICIDKDNGKLFLYNKYNGISYKDSGDIYSVDINSFNIKKYKFKKEPISLVCKDNKVYILTNDELNILNSKDFKILTTKKIEVKNKTPNLIFLK